MQNLIKSLFNKGACWWQLLCVRYKCVYISIMSASLMILPQVYQLKSTRCPHNHNDLFKSLNDRSVNNGEKCVCASSFILWPVTLTWSLTVHACSRVKHYYTYISLCAWYIIPRPQCETEHPYDSGITGVVECIYYMQHIWLPTIYSMQKEVKILKLQLKLGKRKL